MALSVKHKLLIINFSVGSNEAFKGGQEAIHHIITTINN